jgi:hypothetical protein
MLNQNKNGLYETRWIQDQMHTTSSPSFTF